MENELRERLNTGTHKMRWQTPDGWETADCVTVEFAIECAKNLLDKEVTKARQDELKKALDVKFYLPTKVITYLEDRLAQLKENQ